MFFKCILLLFATTLVGCVRNVKQLNQDELEWEQSGEGNASNEDAVTWDNITLGAKKKRSRGRRVARVTKRASRKMSERLTYLPSSREPLGYGSLVSNRVEKYFTLNPGVPESKLYWMKVKVLSEKYGCFMISRYKLANGEQIRCRDHRIIVFRDMPNGRAFISRQFDRHGSPIDVQNHQIVRLQAHSLPSAHAYSR